MIGTLVRALISVLFLGLLFYLLRDEIPAIWSSLQGVEIWPLVVGFLLIFTAIGMLGWRLKLVFKAQHMPSLRWTEAINVTYIGIFFNNFLPTSVGGDVVKAYCVSHKTGDRLNAFSGVFMDRVFALVMFIAIPSVTVIFLRDTLDPMIPKMVYSILAVTLIFLVVLFHKQSASRLLFFIKEKHLDHIPWGRKFLAMYNTMHQLTHEKKLVFQVCLMAVASQLMGIFAIFWIIRALSATVPIYYLFLTVPVVHLFAMLPSINGLGIREMGFVYFFKGALGEDVASALAILYLFYLIILSVIGGVIYLVHHDYHFQWKKIKSPEMQEPAEQETV